MLSFFSKKKHSLETPDQIQGPESEPNYGGDDFIFVEKKTSGDPSEITIMYPPMPPAFGIGNLPYPYQNPAARMVNSSTPVPYIQGIPFELSPQLSSKRPTDIIQVQVDEILALLTHQISAEEEYSFVLERSIQNE